MRLQEFNSRPAAERYQKVYTSGSLLLRKDLPHQTVAVFAVDGFFAVLKVSRQGAVLLNVKGFEFSDLPAEFMPLLDPDNPLVKSAMLSEVLAEAV
jgi:hypothetical protein